MTQTTARLCLILALAFGLGAETAAVQTRNPPAPHLRGHDGDPEAHHRQLSHDLSLKRINPVAYPDMPIIIE